MLSLLFSCVLLTLAYLCGSVCSAIIVAKIFHLPDPRTEGSKNPGTTNILRIAGKPYALLVLLLDMFKGTLPLIIASVLSYDAWFLGLIGLAAILGHIYPVFFEFKGGKGVATALGVYLGLQPFMGFVILIVWATTAFITKYSSLASLIAVCSAPVLMLFNATSRAAFIPLVMIAGLVVYQHRENIQRLKAGTESKIDFSK